MNVSCIAGPKIIGTGLGIPLLDETAMISFDNTAQLIGKTELGKRSIVRRMSEIVNTEIGDDTNLMDYIYADSATIGEHVTIGHGARIGKGATVKNYAAMTINASLGAGSTLSEHCVMLPNCKIGDDLTTPENISMFGGGKTSYMAMPKVHLGDRLEVIGEKYPRTILFRDKDENNLGQFTTHISRVTPFKDFGLHTTDLLDKGLQFWAETIQTETEKARKSRKGKDNTQEETTYFAYYAFFGLQQTLKQLGYLREDAVLYGPVVWHSAHIQADILALDYAARILGDKYHDTSSSLKNIAMANSYLLSAYDPVNPIGNSDAYNNQPNIRELSESYENSLIIISHAITLLRDCSDKQVALPKELWACDVFSGTVPELEQCDITQDYINDIIKRLEAAKKRIGELSAKAPVVDTYTTTPGTSVQDLEISDINEEQQAIDNIKEIRDRINKSGTDITLVEGGTIVRPYYGHIPHISKEAVIIGSDIVGVVDIRGSYIYNCSIRSELGAAPASVNEGSALKFTVIHTGTKDIRPCLVHSNVFANGSNEPGKMVWLHSCVVGSDKKVENGGGEPVTAFTYIDQGSAIVDKAQFAGVCGPDAYILIPGQSYVYRFAFGNHIIDKASNKPDQPRSDNTLEFRSHNNDDHFRAWWNNSPLKNANPEIPSIVTSTISEEMDKAKEKIENEMEELVARYGSIFRYSPQIQPVISSLIYASKILHTNSNTHEAETLSHLAEGIRYLMGMTDEISPAAAKIACKLYEDKTLSSDVKKALKVLGAISEASIHSWPISGTKSESENPYHRTYQWAINQMENSVHPAFSSTDPLISQSIRPADKYAQPVPRIFINNRLNHKLEFTEAQRKEMTTEIEGLPDIIKDLRSLSGERIKTRSKANLINNLP